MLTATTIATHRDYSVHAWTCRDPCSAWSPVERASDARLVLVRAGRFRRRTRGGEHDLDPTVGYLGAPEEEEQFAHPNGGDVCTSLQLRNDSWCRLVGEPPRRRGGHCAVYIDARLDLAHRRLLAAGTDDVDFGLAEQLVGLLAAALRTVADRRTPVTDRSSPTDRRLVQRARAAIHDNHPASRGLFALADHLDCSPYRLSRAFPRELGVSLTRYRNRVRVGWALDGLRGDIALADLAASLGFADQAHFTRTMRAHLDAAPTALRRVLR